MVSQSTINNEPIIAGADDSGALHDAACALAKATNDAANLVLRDGTTVVVPASIVAAIRQVVDVLAANRAVAITPVDKQLTAAQAARMLNVRDTDLEHLLDTGEIPFVSSESFRLIALEDLLAYKRIRDAQTREALREVTRLSQEMGFYQPHEGDPGTT